MALKRLAKDVGLLILSLGMLINLVGTLFITDGSRVATLLNLTFFLPALVLTACIPAYRARLFSRELIFVALFLAFTVLIAALNSHSDHSPKDQLKVAVYVLMYLSAILILALEDKLERLLTWSFYLASAAAAASLVYQRMVLGNDIFGIFRISSLGYGDYANFNNAIVSALYYGVFSVFGVHQLANKPMAPWHKAVWALCVAVLILYVFGTGSRGIWLGMLAAFFASIWMHMQAGRRTAMVALAAVCVSVALVVKFVFGHEGRGLSLRDEIWGGWFHRLGEFWLTGAGAGNAFNICVSDTRCYKQAHNLYLQVGYEFGLFAVVLLLLLIGVAMVRGLHRSQWEKPLGSAGIALMIFAAITAVANYHSVLSRPGVYWLVFWLPVGLLIHARLMPVLRGNERVAKQPSGI
jgi:O-antigen ligase